MGKHDIKYHNDMNLVSIGALNSSQIDILFSIGLTMAKDCSNKVIISFNEIKELANYSNKNIKNFYRDLEGLFKKLLDLDFRIETETNIKRMNLFQYYDIQKDNGVVEIKANEIFLKLFDNMLRGNFTLFDLKDLVSLKSGYSKLMFKLLRGWNGKKKINYTLEELYYLLGVPLSVQTTANFTNKVMKPIKEELPKYFNKLEIETIKTGRKITGYSFTWKPKASETELIGDNHIHISEKLNRTIEKVKKNRHLQSLLTEENIIKLLEKFNEEQLIKGLTYAYKEIQKKIEYLSYLEKAIETGAGKQETKIVVEANIPKEVIEIKELETVESIGESKEEKNETYIKFCKMSDNEQLEIEKIVYKDYVKKCGQDTKIQRLAFKAGKRKLITDYLESKKIIHNEVEKCQKETIKEKLKDEVVEIKKKKEITQSKYNTLLELRLSMVRSISNEIDVEEEKRKFDLKIKEEYIIVETKEITREELLNKFDQLSFSYPFKELEDAIDIIGIKYTNQEWLNLINDNSKRKELDNIIEKVREFKAGF
ncbi:RepB family plasmid replication initiator protein [Cetobacterium sp. 8H]|uniref:replication initiation protein n=1 Tax=Cetobacterium sp. 8H TaxID=2759681 RepID=UPI00163C12F5|nr:RepB family plasmid replication initiator protein [Cetobacterium sp. 8H]MBC2849846.1 RepB family plasmid replication initiator protein [Cetobacterium sp. 8H]MBC2849863.1 RepB family plasmid replication initiator protein [Cetobacterium sp. 8H]